jgi:hypothetical protein
VKQKKEQKKKIEKEEKQLREAKIVAPSSAAATSPLFKGNDNNWSLIYRLAL